MVLFPFSVRCGYQFCWWKIGAGRCPERWTNVKWKLRKQPWVQVELQSTTCLTCWWRLRAPNRYHSPCIRRDVCRAWQSSAYTQTARITNADVTVIVNAQPISAKPRDADEPQPLSHSMLLTMKTRPLGPPPGNFVSPNVYAQHRLRHVQYLAD